jgi:membrane protease subunit (stomatin/prohibitin family)
LPLQALEERLAEMRRELMGVAAGNMQAQQHLQQPQQQQDQAQQEQEQEQGDQPRIELDEEVEATQDGAANALQEVAVPGFIPIGGWEADFGGMGDS